MAFRVEKFLNKSNMHKGALIINLLQLIPCSHFDQMILTQEKRFSQSCESFHGTAKCFGLMNSLGDKEKMKSFDASRISKKHGQCFLNNYEKRLVIKHQKSWKNIEKRFGKCLTYRQFLILFCTE